MKIPDALERLIRELAHLPGIGRKTAQRLAFSILRGDPARASELAAAIRVVREQIRFCDQCFGYAEAALCPVCSDHRRDPALLCVVEQPGDLYVIERGGVFTGLYHVLLGTISPLDGIGPGQLKIAELVQRVERRRPREIIIATNPSIEGEATALHLSRVLAGKVDRISRLARGMPVGGNLEYTDDVTLNQAFAGRQDFASS